MIDLHCHILPGVDDGAPDLGESMAMLHDAMEQGCRALVATSHLWESLFDTSPQALRREYATLVHAVQRKGLAIEILPGAENFLSEGAPPDKFAEKAVPLGEEGRYVLFDFSLRAVPSTVPEVIDALRENGRGAVIAHPERNLELQSDPTPIADWIERGALIQVNAGSLIGYLGESARRSAEYLVECGAAHLLASDAHDRKRRPFCLEHGRQKVVELIDEDAANLLARDNPWKVARGEDVPTRSVEIEPPSGTRKLFRRFLRR